MMEVKVTKTTNPKVKPDPATVPFGVAFTDHMFMMEYDSENGWQNPRIVPFGDISLNPGALVFHYGAEVFEGLKAYRTPSGEVQMFRPAENFKRMNNSAERLCLPQFDVEDAVEYLRKFVEVEKDWVPDQYGTSLYLRPFLFGTDADLALHGISHATFMVIACVVGSYYKSGLAPVDMLIEMDDVRAVRGGTGYAKCGGNYAAATRAGEKAAKKGYSQVVWVDGVERKYVEEVGTMNVMFKIDNEIYTAPIDGTVLPGVTRDSCIALLKEWGYKVHEEHFTIDFLMEAAREGKLEEAFGTGTAAVISPVGELNYKGEIAMINDFKTGELTQKLYDTLTDIQWGKAEDKFNWTYEVKR